MHFGVTDTSDFTRTEDNLNDRRRDSIVIAAVCARKSTDQSGVTDEAKSVCRQIEHAHSYAARKGQRTSAPAAPSALVAAAHGTPTLEELATVPL